MQQDLDPIWKALANPVRREILDCLREGARTTGDLVFEFPDLSRYAVMQHLEVLVEAGLVVSRREGRLRFNHLNAVPIQQIYERWVKEYEGHWASALIRLKGQVERNVGRTGSRVASPSKGASPRGKPRGGRFTDTPLRGESEAREHHGA